MNTLCESCREREATVFLAFSSADEQPEHKFCKSCADDFYVSAGMNSSRDLICLSKWFRSKLYDLLEQEHPNAFDNTTTEACERGTEVMNAFLKEQLSKNGIQLNDDGFDMLCSDFFGHREFYDRADRHAAKANK